jgi:hypothetical protein
MAPCQRLAAAHPRLLAEELVGHYRGAIAVAVTTAILALTMMSYLNQLTGLTWSDALRPQRPAFVASVVMAGAVCSHQYWGEGVFGPHPPALLFSSTMVGASVYVMVLWLLRPPPVVALVKELLTGLKSAARGAVR